MVVERFASLFAEELRLVYKWNYLLIEFPGITRMNYKSKIRLLFLQNDILQQRSKKFLFTFFGCP